jgi:hypothetical protein
MLTIDLKDLLETVELIRKDLHPDLDPAFLTAVVRAEEENPDDDSEAIHGIESALRAVLAKKEIL